MYSKRIDHEDNAAPENIEIIAVTIHQYYIWP